MLAGARWIAVAVVAASVAAPGCSVKKMALRITADLMSAGQPAINEEPDYQLARDAFPASLKTVEVFLRSDPANRNLLFILAQGYVAYSQLVLEDDIDLADAAGDMARVKQLQLRTAGLYERAQGYAARLLGPVEVRRDLEDARADVAKARMGKLGKDDVPGLFWYTMAWVGRINMDQSDPARIAELPRVEELIARVIELDEKYFDGLPLLMAGGVAAGRPAMFGGDPAKGKALFERGIAVSGGRFLIGKFLFARYYAVAVQDHPLFCSLLRDVLAAPDDSLPRQQLMNNVSKRWAARWLGRAGDLFAEGGACPAPAPVPGTNVEVDDGSLE